MEKAHLAVRATHDVHLILRNFSLLLPRLVAFHHALSPSTP